MSTTKYIVDNLSGQTITGNLDITGTLNVEQLEFSNGSIQTIAYTGEDGTSGTSGVSGTSGTSGTSGVSGATGSDGISGTDGTSGSSGTDGTSGISGDKYRTSATGEYTLGVVSGGTLTVSEDYGYSVAQSILVVYDKDNYQTSSVLSYDGVTGELVFSGAAAVVGSGTYTGWTVNLAGAAGGDGSSGTDGTSGTSGISPSGNTLTYTFTGGTTWTMTHNLGTLTPLVQAYESNGNQIIPQNITIVNSNVVTITFSTSTAGRSVVSSGLSGTSGINGSSGSSGTSNGTSGTDGTSGTNGANGTDGTSGVNGTSGSSGVGVPSGGTSTQILRKIDGTNFNTEWYGLSYASLLFNQLNINANSDITPVLSNANGITVVGNTIVISQPGVYSLFASLPYRRGSFVEYRWVDAANDQLVGTNAGIASPSNANDVITTSPAAGIVIITSPNTVIKLRTGNLGGLENTQQPGYAIATIIQLR